MSPSQSDVIGQTEVREERVARSRPKLDPENPWPGLDAYGEDSTEFFKGREEETTELLRLIRLSPLTVLYSKSGLGKTSLLEAGLFPQLRAAHFLPVYLRLDFSSGLTEPLTQSKQALKDALRAAKAEFPELEPDQSLWEYLHRKNPEIWSADNYPLTPVLVFDQFEELFSRSGGNAELIKQVFDDLADLIENRIPAEVAAETAGEKRSHLDLLTQHYRVVVSFREDFLPDMRTWEKQVPSLLRSYLRLEPMSRSRAIKAVEEAGKAVLEQGIAAQIVDFVGKPDGSAPSTATSEVVIDPVLLSLCCTQLNHRRAPGSKIDYALLKGAGEGILEKFYSDALDDPEVKGPPGGTPFIDVAPFIEDKLIQGDFRGDYPKEEALEKNYLTARQLTALTDRLRLLRIVSHADTARIELIHDRLVPVIGKARDQRLLRERQDEQDRKAREAVAERDKERARSEALRRSLKAAKRNRNIAVAAAVASIVVLLWGWHERNEKQHLKLRGEVAVNTARLAEGRLALGPGREPLEQTMYRGLAAYRLTNRDPGVSQARAASLTALHWVLENSGHLFKALTIDSLMPTPALTYSPDGKMVAVGGEDGVIRLLQLDGETYREINQLDCHPPHGEAVWSLAFSPDGERLAAGYNLNDDNPHASGLVCVFDVAKRSVIRQWSAARLSGKPGSIFSVDYGGKKGEEFVVSGGSDKILRLLDVQTGEAHAVAMQHGEVVAVAVSPDGRLVASGGDDAVIRTWNVDDLRRPNPKPQHELEGHQGVIQQVEFSRVDPSKLVSAGDDGRIIVWNAKRACLIEESPIQGSKIYGIAIRPTGDLVAAASADGNVRLFSISKADLPCVKPDAPGAASTKPGNPEVSLVEDGILAGHGGFVLAVAWNQDGSRLASTGQEGSIRIWGPANSSFSTAQLIVGTDAKPGFGTPSVTKVAISPDGRTVAAGDNLGFIHVWDRPPENTEPIISHESVPPWSAHQGAIGALAFTRIDERVVLVSGGEDGLVKRWGSDGKAISPDMVDAAVSIRSIALSPDGKVLAAGSSDGSVRLWDAATGTLKLKFPKREGTEEGYQFYTVGFTSDGKHLALGDYTNDVVIRDSDKVGSERALIGHSFGVNALSRGGDKWLLSAGPDGSVLEWEESALSRPRPQGLKKQDEFRYRLGFRNLKALTSLDVSSDGKWILTGGEGGQVQLWDGVEHVLIGRRFTGHGTKRIQSVAMAPDGSFFVTADNQKILVWRGPDRWADMVCSKLYRNMSRKQWREWVSPDIPYEEQCSGPDFKIAPD